MLEEINIQNDKIIYNNIKEKLIKNESYSRVKDYSKNRNTLKTYYEVGKLLREAGKHYGEGIIKQYSQRLIIEVGKKFSVRYLFDIRKLYLFSKVHPLDAKLTMSHYRLLFTIKNDVAVNYYINETIKHNLGKRQLRTIIKQKEYERLDESTKEKLKTKEELSLIDEIKDPILIENNNKSNNISEYELKELILDKLDDFLK